METLHSTMFTSTIGPLFLAASVRGLVALEFDARLPGQQTIRPNPRDLRAVNARKRRLLSQTALDYLRLLKNPAVKIRFDIVEVLLADGKVHELEEYFAGERREFSFALD